MQYRYRAFISYNHVDEKWATWLHRSLEAYRIPGHIVDNYQLKSNRLIPIFRDREELPSSNDLSASIRQALADSANLIVICSRAAAASRWVDEEINAFKQMGRADRIFCLLIDDPEHGFPPAVLVDTDGDGVATVRETEPLAANPDSDADGKSGALLKLISGLLDVRLDDLRQRENRRRHRKMAFVAAGSLTGMAVAIVLSVFALVSRNEATRQQAIAERQAETSQQVTDFLVDLFNYSDPFAEPGTDLKATEILARGAERIEHDLSAEPIVQARLMTAIGKVYSQLGFYDHAEKHLNHAATIQNNLLPSGASETLQTQIHRAWVAIQTEDLELAESIYEAILPALNEQAEFVEALPHEDIWSAAANDFGVYLHGRGDYTKASKVLEQALALHENTDSDFATTLSNLGLVKFDQGNYEAAYEFYERALEIQTRIDGRDHPSLTALLMNSAAALRRLGELGKAQARLEHALAIAEASFDANHPATAYICNGLGIVHFKTGDLDGALKFLERAGDIMIGVQGPMHSFVAANFQHQARVFNQLGDLDRARFLYEKSMSSYIGSVGADHPEIIGVYAELAELLVKTNELERAKTLYLKSLEIANERLGPSNNYSKRLQQQYAKFLEFSTQ
jgi:tetratricopeptide (TPR) repeat protein